MTEAELRVECKTLKFMQQQFDQAVGTDAAVMVQIPGTIVKHVYSDRLAGNVMKAIARVLENERLRILTINKKR